MAMIEVFVTMLSPVWLIGSMSLLIWLMTNIE